MSTYRLVVLVLILALCGCDAGIREMGPNEVGVVFHKLPPILGGGVSGNVIGRGEKRIVMPWDQIYRFNTTPRFITWGAGKGRNTIFARAKDGNEVALTVTLSYQVSRASEGILKLMQEFATSNEAIDSLVEVAARSDVRTFMNELATLEFREAAARAQALEKVRRSLTERFGSFGIEIISVNLDDFQFKRLAPDGTEDATYQKMIDQIQARTEDTKRKVAEEMTITEAKKAELAAVDARVVSLVREAEGYKEALRYRGDAYLKTKSNDAAAIKALGDAEVKGLIAQIEALSGPGGMAMLKLEIAKQMLKNDPRYILMPEQKAGGLDVKRTDTNELINQLGINEALQPKVLTKTEMKVPGVTAP